MTHYSVSFKSRNAQLSEKQKARTEEKLLQATKYDPSLTFVSMEFLFEPNPQRGDEKHKVHITATGAQHVARVEAVGENFLVAEDKAIAKLKRSLRKVKSQRTVAKSGHRTPLKLVAAVQQTKTLPLA